MLTNFWQGLGDKLAEKWLAGIVVPSAVFWLGGLLVWIAHFGSTALEMWFTHLTPILQGVVLISVLLVSALAGSIIQRLIPLLLRLLEGYCPRWLGGLRLLCVNHQRRVFTKAQNRWEELRIKEHKMPDDFGPEERHEYAVLDQRLKHFPTQIDQLMPTRLGNMLRAAEQRPTEKYGLDVLVCWPRLWLILPENARTELVEARANLNTAVGFWLWSMLFLLWTSLAWWAFPIGLIAAFCVYRWIIGTAEVYGDLLEAAFDIHRIALYQALHWPPPTRTDEEPAAGKVLSSYLLRGGSSLSKPVVLKYTDQKPPDEAGLK
jgi:hypothetical protein